MTAEDVTNQQFRCCNKTCSIQMAKIIFLSCEAQTLFCHSSKQSYLSKATLNEWLKLKNFPLLYLEKIFLKHILYIASCLETCR